MASHFRRADFWKGALRLRLNQVPVSPVKMESRPNAVLALVGDFEKNGHDSILLTKRTSTMEHYRSHVSFPGGRAESRDKSLLETALREASEEIGLQVENVEVLGALPTARTKDNLPIFPWLGWLHTPQAWVLSEREVEKLLFLSLGRLCSEGLSTYSVPIPEYGISVESRGIEVDGELVWGATGRMLEDLRTLLLSVSEVPSR